LAEEILLEQLVKLICEERERKRQYCPFYKYLGPAAVLRYLHHADKVKGKFIRKCKSLQLKMKIVALSLFLSFFPSFFLSFFLFMFLHFPKSLHCKEKMPKIGSKYSQKRNIRVLWSVSF